MAGSQGYTAALRKKREAGVGVTNADQFIADMESNARALPRTLYRAATGIPENLLSMATGAGSMVAGGLAGGSKIATDWANQKQPNLDEFTDTVDRTMQAGTYQPRLPESQELQGALGSALRGAGESFDKTKAGKGWSDFTARSPAAAAMLVGVANIADPEMVGAKAGVEAGGRSAITRSLRKTATDAAVSDAEFMAQMRQHMTPREIERMKPRDVNALRDRFYEAKGLSPEVLGPAAEAGRAKKGWYKGSSDALSEVFGSEKDRFVALLAATSPRTSVQANLKTALTMWRDWNKAGRPKDAAAIDALLEDAVQRSEVAAADKSSVLGAWRANTHRALGDEFLNELEPHQALISGPKVESFRRNLMGDPQAVTNDAWQATATGQDPKVFSGRSMPVSEKRQRGLPDKTTFSEAGPGYVATSAQVREVAKQLTERTGEAWTPEQVQETVWSLTKAAWEKADAEGISINDALQSLTHNEVGGVPDFAGLLPTDEYGQLLRESGYGPELDRMAGRTPAKLPKGKPADVGAALTPFTKQLANTFMTRRLPAELRALRGKFSQGVDDAGSLLYRTEAGGANVPPGLRGLVEATHTPNAELVSALRRHGGRPGPIHELHPRGAEQFRDRLLEARAQLGPMGESVYVYSPEEYAQMRLFLGDKGAGAGFALKNNALGPDLVSLFNSPKVSGQGGFSFPALALGQREGVKTLDAFDTNLPHRYSMSGMQEAARAEFDPQYAPEGWNQETMRRYNVGKPDVSFMAQPAWVPNEFGKFVPPNVPVVPEAPRRYSAQSKARQELLRKKNPEKAQAAIIAGDPKLEELRAIASQNKGRVPPNNKALARYLRKRK